MEKLISGLTDISFKKFITPHIAPSLYIIGLVFLGVQCVAMVLWGKFFGIILAAITLVSGAIFLRVFIELILSIFQIARYSAEIARRGRPQEESGNEEAYEAGENV